MRAVIRRAAISAVAALFALPSIAGPVVYEVISPVQLLKVLQAEDRSITLNNSAGDATISGGVSGHPFDIYFYDCDGGGFVAPARPGSACLGFEFRAYFEGYPNDAEIVNAWNNAHHYGALWRDDGEDLALQLNVIVEGGVTEANIRSNYKWWRKVMPSLKQFPAE